MFKTAWGFVITLWIASAAFPAAGQDASVKTGNVVFLHPDGAGVNSWGALRMLVAGPDGELAWDRIPHIGVYRGHMKDSLTATSHGGATTHAYGVKVPADSFGMDGKEPLVALSGYPGSIMQEALARGKAVGIVQTGHIGEPGTGCFLAAVPSRGDVESIAAQVLTAGADVILCGGERFMLPKETQGVHGPGAREDGRNLIEEARAAGYTVVYDRAQLQALDLVAVERLLGVFAESNTFNDVSEEKLAARNLPLYKPDAPSYAEMIDAALAILSRKEQGFLLVAEEEGSDNFGNCNNSRGALEALRRADEGYAAVLRYLERHPDTLLLTASDSDAGGMQVIMTPRAADAPLPATTSNGAPLDGREGTATQPFLSAPDRDGRQFSFGIAFADYGDTAGGIVARAAGLHADKLPLNTDNTDIYRLMYYVLFGKDLGLPSRP